MQNKFQNCDLKKMLKHQKDRLQKIQKEQNPFVLSTVYTEQQVRKQLYTLGQSVQNFPTIKSPKKQPQVSSSLTKKILNKTRNNLKNTNQVKHKIEVNKDYLNGLELKDKKDIIYTFPFIPQNQPYQIFNKKNEYDVSEQEFEKLDEQFLREKPQNQQSNQKIKITTQQGFKSQKQVQEQFEIKEERNLSQKVDQRSGRWHDINCQYGHSKVQIKLPNTQNEYYNGQKIKKNSPEKSKRFLNKTQKPIDELQLSIQEIKQKSVHINSKQSSAEKREKVENIDEIIISKEDLKISEIIQNTFKKQKVQVNQIQNSLFFDKTVHNQLKQIQTGEQAIAFFAKYANTTPIKFIYCQSVKSEQFRPYDLVVLKNQDVSKIQNDYFIITSLGIVHINNQNKEEQREIKKVQNTNVVTLSDWMNEATLFTVIREIHFFQKYANLKIFLLWKKNTYLNIFKSTRNKINQKSILSRKPFTSYIVQIINVIFELQQRKLVNENIFKQNKTWDIDDMKTDQRNVKQEQSQHFNNVVDKIIEIIQIIIIDIEKRNNIPDPQVENIKNNLNMSVPKLRKAIHDYQIFITQARLDKSKLRNLIRLIDYMVLQRLYYINCISVTQLKQEILKDNRKQGGLINTVSKFETSFISFTPDESEILTQCLSYMSQSFKILDNVTRVLYSQNLSSVVQSHVTFDIKKIVINSQWFIESQQSIIDKISLDFQNANQFVNDNYEKCRIIENDIIFLDNPKNSKEYYSQEYDQNQTRDILENMRQWKKLIDTYLKDIQKGIMNIQSNKIKTKFQNHINSKIDFFKENLYKIIRNKTIKVLNQSIQITEQLQKFPNSLQEYGKYIEITTSAPKLIQEIQDQKILIDKMTSTIRKFDTSIIRQIDVVQTSEINSLLTDLVQVQKQSNEYIKKKLPDYGDKIEKAYLELQKDISATDLQINVGNLIIPQLNENTTFNKIMKDLQAPKLQIQELNYKLDRYKEKNQSLNQIAKLMKKKEKENNELTNLFNKFNDRKALWDMMEDYKEKSNIWINNQFSTLNIEEIEQTMKNYELTIVNLKIRISNLSETNQDNLLDIFVNELKNMQVLMPFIIPLGNQDMIQRHWKQIFELLRPDYNPGKFFSLNDLINEGLADYQEYVEEISNKASGESYIQIQLENIQKRWEDLQFQVIPYADYKDRYKLVGVDEILINLEDNSMNIQSMLSSKYVVYLRPKVEEWEKKLLLISEIIDEWLNCQRSWMYLENIFNAPDIQDQLPNEAQKFQVVDKFFTGMMTRTYKKPIVQTQCNSEELLHKFQANNKALDDIQKCLEKYLEAKRIAFPRFYFLSNDELLQILSQTRNPQAVQPHLRKCFDNIIKIQFSDEPESRKVLSMQSAQPESMPEIVQLHQPVIIENEEKVENWLMKIQKMMIQTIFQKSKKCLLNYDKNNRQQWLLDDYPAQSVILIENIKWQETLTQALISRSQRSIENVLNEYENILAQLIEIVSTKLNLLQRTLICTLLVIDVHLRDVIAVLSQEQDIKIEDFQWTKQMRYYWLQEQNQVQIQQTNSKLDYSYEYLGNGQRLVMTPLTDNTYLTMTNALHLHFGGSPQGPAGTGKTETIKDLAKAVAILCVVFNCSENLDFRTMGRLFSGLAQCGAWACFDEFNRIDIEVLSVIAQQISTIQASVKNKDKKFDFQGYNIALDLRFGVFVTMNPGYAGRTELPDNLKSLLRPIAMMIPDYDLIAEIMLMSDGFKNARILSQKMICLFRLSSEQLSKPKHYDFGMRAVKSVLTMAGIIKRQNQDQQEEMILIKAISDTNIPKFLDQDLPLFKEIIHDLFPEIIIQQQEFIELKNAAIQQFQLIHYQAFPNMITKILQLMETQKVRHGVMLVGNSGVGKSTVFDILRKSIIQLYNEGFQDAIIKNIQLQKINPKSVSINNLYGYMNLLTNEWNDGIVANIVREAVESTNDDIRWLMLDGPVDSLWIENLNTVLDENKMLCLSNGQRIKLPQNFVMFFEVIDLIQASPATVSRCGMIYFDQNLLHWKSIIYNWSIKFKIQYIKNWNMENDLRPITFAFKNLQSRVTNLFEDSLEFIRTESKEAIKSIDINLVSTCLEIIQHLFDNLIDFFQGMSNLEKQSAIDLESYFNMMIIFGFIWSIGGNVYDTLQYQGRYQYSKFIKQKIIGFYTGFPFEGEIYDYYIDFEQRKFVNWNQKIPNFNFDKNKQFYDIIVPTNDTVKYGFLIDFTIAANQHICLNGNSGVGKSNMIMNYLKNLGESYQSLILNFSAQTTAKSFQETFNNKDAFTRRKKDLLAPTNNQIMVIFIDDFNLPQPEEYGAQPPIELLVQMIDHGGFYDLKKLFFSKIINIIFILACSPPGGGRHQTTPRLFRHFNMIWIGDLNKITLEQIYSEILKGYFAESKIENLMKLIKNIVSHSVDIYLKIQEDFLPTPSKCHYTFNSRDLAKLFQGMLQVKLQYLETEQNLLDLWIHELQRVFYDRLNDQNDREKVLEMIKEKLTQEFKYSLELNEIINIKFCDFDNEDKEYQFTQKPDELFQIFTDKLIVYNSEKPKQMNLILFEDAINTVCKICRILRIQRGNSLLIGVGGTGRSSLAKLGAYICDLTTFQIELFKGYKEQQWKDDFKKLIKQAGSKNIPTLFLFSDTQILYESFLQDISNILNGGDILNLMATDDLEEINNDLKLILKDKGIVDTRDNLIKLFKQLMDQNLHIILTFSPVGEKLRHRCNQFPALINCTTIIWFDQWKDSALQMIAQKEYQMQENLGIAQYQNQLAYLCVLMHKDVTEKSSKYLVEYKRHVYTTPTSYLDLIKLYIQLLKINQNILPLQIRKYTIGLQTLKDTNKEVAKLQQTIYEFQPVLKDQAEQNKILIQELEVQTKLSAQTQETISKDTIEAQKTRDEVKELQINCQKQYDDAIPILLQAQEAVKDIDKTQLQILKTFTQPHNTIKLTIEATCLLFDYEQSWEAGKRYLLGDMKFLDKLINFNADAIDEKRFKKLRKKYLSIPELNSQNLEKVSSAASQIFKWIKSINEYDKIKKMIDPRKKKLDQAQKTLYELDIMLIEKKQKLKEIDAKVLDLDVKLSESLQREKEYEMQMIQAKQQLERAELLAQGLSIESERWNSINNTLIKRLTNLTGDILISASMISYLAPFPYIYRSQLTQKWVGNFINKNIPTSEDFDIIKILSNESQIQEWSLNNLPTDNFSIQNSISVLNTRKFPLIIDPQNQATNWIKKQYEHKNINQSNFTDVKFYKNLENCIKFGIPLLVENVKEELDPILDPILLKQTYKKGIQNYIKLGDQDIQFNNEFYIFFCSRLSNPHYLPEIFIKANIINFTVSMLGLEDQLLVEVVSYERNDLELTRLELMKKIEKDEKLISQLEDQILFQIGEAQGKMLDSDNLIQTLKQSRELSSEIEQRIKESKATQEEIKQAREEYRNVAKRGSILYFSISDMSLIDPMYQWSLEFFTLIFKMRLEKVQKSNDLQERLKNLIEDITVSIYQNISRGLFTKDRLFFSFLIVAKAQIREQIISQADLIYFIRAQTSINQKSIEFPNFIKSHFQEQLLILAEFNKKLEKFITEISKYPKYWSDILESENPFAVQLPSEYQFDDFYKLHYIKILREDCLLYSIQQYIQNTLGSELVNSPPFNLKNIYLDSSKINPIIFILSSGSDPMNYLYQFENEGNLSEGQQLKILSLGQGQGGKAQELILEGRIKGDWICLQNCHLAITWLPKLEKMLESNNDDQVHNGFRLWLTSMPTKAFPISILQSGIKITNEPPRGFKANMLQSFSNIKEQDYNSCTNKRLFQKMIFSLSFFHTVITERKKFGSIGWNTNYDWMISDFNISFFQIKELLNENQQANYNALNTIIGEINYGGRVTDQNDMILIKSLLKTFINPELEKEQHVFYDIYKSPQDMQYNEVIDYIKTLPLQDHPEIFGLNQNADITSQIRISKEFFNNLQITAPNVDVQKEPGQNLEFVCKIILRQIQDKINIEIDQENDKETTCSLLIFRNQELVRYRLLIKEIFNSIQQLQMAISGQIVMSQDLEQMFHQIINGKVPQKWINYSYLSLKTLHDWISDLNIRLEFWKNWIEKKYLKSYLISAFYFPQGFITSLKQGFSRKQSISIEKIIIQSEIKSNYYTPLDMEYGACIYGIFLQGCKINEKQYLEESINKELIIQIPYIILKPQEKTIQQNDIIHYSCPFYKTAVRQGSLDSTGLSTNFIMRLNLKTQIDPQVWIKRGVAMLCQIEI